MKTNLNRPFLKREDIMDRRNFKEVMLRYRMAHIPFYKSAKFFGGLGVAASIIIVAVIYYNINGNASPFVNPPLKELRIQPTGFVVNAREDTTLSYHTGSVIRIPAGTFMDKKGKVVTGKVDVRYREFHDATEFFASGIPMNYDSAGVSYTFQSAGMMEIEAFKDGEQLTMNPAKQISISLASSEPENKFNLYFLDTVAKKWVYKGNPRLTITEPDSSPPITYLAEDADSQRDTVASIATASIREVKKDISLIEASKPFEPRKATDYRRRFSLDVDSAEFPELTVYSNMKFEIGAENTNFDTTSYSKTWENAELKENEKGKNYTLTLTRKRMLPTGYVIINESFSADSLAPRPQLNPGLITVSYIVYPVFEGINYDVAMKEYREKFAGYEKKLAEKKREQARLIAEARVATEKARMEQEASLKKQMEQWETEQMQSMDQQKKYIEELREEANKSYAQQKRRYEVFASISREFTIGRMGIWNCDCPNLISNPVRLQAKFRDDTGKTLNSPSVYLIDKDRNMLYVWENSEIVYDPNANYVMFAVLPDDRIAVFSSSKFKSIDRSLKSYTFIMHVLDEKFTTSQSLKEKLNG